MDPSSERGLILSGSDSLIVVSARLSDSGSNFSCVAENNAGRRISEPATLTVYGRPDQYVPIVVISNYQGVLYLVRARLAVVYLSRNLSYLTQVL